MPTRLLQYQFIYVIFRVSGYMMSEKIGIPRRRVKKNWYVGLHSDPVDRSHPDVKDDLLVMEAAEKMSRKLFLHSYKFYICSILSLLSWGRGR